MSPAARAYRWSRAGTNLLPVWFSRLHPRYKTPINSIIFVGTITLVIAIASQIGAGIQEAFQLVDNAANVFYGIVYFMMFAIPIFGAATIRAGAPIWLRFAAVCGLVVSLSGDFLHGLSDHRRAESADFRGENRRRHRDRQRHRRGDFLSVSGAVTPQNLTLELQAGNFRSPSAGIPAVRSRFGTK